MTKQRTYVLTHTVTYWRLKPIFHPTQEKHASKHATNAGNARS